MPLSILGNIGIRNLTTLLNAYLFDNNVLRSFYAQLYNNYTPDITGYTIIFMEPPDLSGFKIDKSKNDAFRSLVKHFIYLATDFTPPQTQVVPAQVTSRSGALSYASDIMSTEDISISFIEKSPITVYNAHLLWVEYMREILRGTIEPDPKYLNPNDVLHYGAIDYLGSFFIVKYLPDMKEITYIGKCIGVFPKTLPSKQLIGTRTTNEICVLPFEYSCIAYREFIPDNDVVKNVIPTEYQNIWIFEEFNKLVADLFKDEEKLVNQIKDLF